MLDGTLSFVELSEICRHALMSSRLDPQIIPQCGLDERRLNMILCMLAVFAPKYPSYNPYSMLIHARLASFALGYSFGVSPPFLWREYFQQLSVFQHSRLFPYLATALPQRVAGSHDVFGV